MKYTPKYEKKFDKAYLIFIFAGLFIAGMGMFCIYFPDETNSPPIWLAILFVSLPLGISILFTVLSIRGFIFDKRVKKFITEGKEEEAIISYELDTEKTGRNHTPLYKVYLSVTDLTGKEITYIPDNLYSSKMVAQLKEEGTIKIYTLNDKCLPFPQYMNRYTKEEQANTFGKLKHTGVYKNKHGVEIISAPSEAYEDDSTPMKELINIAHKTYKVANIIKGILIGAIILAIIIFVIIAIFK